MESYDCNAGCGGCGSSCSGSYTTTNSMNDVYSQKNSYSTDNEDWKKYAMGGDIK